MEKTANAINPFWEFSLALYRQPGVERVCLELQDSFTINVNVLLWACWLETLGLPLNLRLLDQAQRAVRAWDTSVVKPIRQARRAVRNGDWAAPGPTLLEPCRDLELEAEKIQQQWLYQLAEHHSDGAETAVQVGENIELLLRAGGVADHGPATGVLVAGMKKICRVGLP